jgi:hypothetical protein
MDDLLRKNIFLKKSKWPKIQYGEFLMRDFFFLKIFPSYFKKKEFTNKNELTENHI